MDEEQDELWERLNELTEHLDTLADTDPDENAAHIWRAFKKYASWRQDEVSGMDGFRGYVVDIDLNVFVTPRNA